MCIYTVHVLCCHVKFCVCVCVACELSVSHALTTFILQNGLVEGVGRAILSCARVVMFVDLLGIQRMSPRIWVVWQYPCWGGSVCVCVSTSLLMVLQVHTLPPTNTHVHICYSWYISRHFVWAATSLPHCKNTLIFEHSIHSRLSEV